MDNTLERLTEVLNQRKTQNPDESYVASLYAAGIDRILKKIGEESAELIMAAKDGDPEKIIHETADLWFHTLVMLANAGLGAEDILGELDRRFGVSGHEEKAARGK